MVLLTAGLLQAYCDFFAGSCVVLLLAPPADEPEVPPLDDWFAVSLLGVELLEPLAPLLGEVLEPPEAEPDFEASLEPEAPPPIAELDELEPEGDAALPEGEPALPEGDAALPEGEELAPAELEEPEGEVDGDAVLELAEPEGDEDGGVALLELEEPGADEDLELLPLSHAARPKAIVSATARVDSFMSPPWLG